MDYVIERKTQTGYLVLADISGYTSFVAQTEIEYADIALSFLLEADGLIFWFHSYDALHENRASVHVGKGSQNDHNDAKIWLEPKVEIARAGKTLKTQELNKAVKVIEQDLEYLLEEWHGYRNKANK